MSRRPRPIDFATYKAQEWCYLVLAYFPCILECIPAEREDSKLWHIYIYIVRAYNFSRKEFNRMGATKLKDLCEAFYRLYQKLYGAENCVYNVHLLHHLPVLGLLGPLSTTSTIKFESSYATLTRKTPTGTTNVTSQMLKQAYTSFASGHVCRKRLYFKETVSDRTRDDLVYCFDSPTGQYVFYRIHKIRATHLTCTQVTGLPYADADTAGDSRRRSNLDFNTCGVYRVGQECLDMKHIKYTEVDGKGIICRGYLVALPKNVLLQ
jgi:hypothetical protein